MSRLLILITLATWFVWDSSTYRDAIVAPVPGSMIFLGGLALLVGCFNLWGRRVVRRLGTASASRKFEIFQTAIASARLVLPVWLVAGLYLFNWGRAVHLLLGPVYRWPVDLPGLLLATMPILVTWVGLMWAQYPVETALREHHMLYRLEDNLPIHPTPGLRSYLDAHLRMQLLFTLAPVLLIGVVRDLISLIAWRGFAVDLRRGGGANDWVESAAMLLSSLAVIALAPEILRRALRTISMPASALRDRLDAMCHRLNLRCHDILIWQTDHNICNAIVMGLFPRVRYVLLTDLLLESMTDEQIEAVFAHEAGHIKHRHIAWYVVMVALILATLMGPAESLARFLSPMLAESSLEFLMTVLGIVGFIAIFATLSRSFERQADVFAARTLQGRASPNESFVGPQGAVVFNSALQTVARISGMPTDLQSRPQGGVFQRILHGVLWLRFTAANWTHGSIGQRMRYLESLSDDSVKTQRFDRRMILLYASLTVALVGSTIWAIALARSAG